MRYGGGWVGRRWWGCGVRYGGGWVGRRWWGCGVRYGGGWVGKVADHSSYLVR